MKKTIIIILILTALGVGGWFAYDKLFKRNKNGGVSSADSSSSSDGSTSTGTSSSSTSGNLTKATSFPMSQGSRGDKVAELQRELNKVKGKSYNDLSVDGIWGAKTQRALDSMVTPPYTLDFFRTIKDESSYKTILSLIKAKQSDATNNYISTTSSTKEGFVDSLVAGFQTMK